MRNLRESENLIEDFRAKFDPGKMDLSVKRIDLISVTEEAVQRAKRKISDSISIISDNSLEERELIDCLLTEQFGDILDNLIDNAIEAMPDGGQIKIHIYLEDPLTAGLSISDTGVGMSAETQEQIYDFGFTTKRKRRRGHGLGMWFVRMYVHRFAGQINFTSAPGEGTTFNLRFPIAFSDESSFNVPTQEPSREDLYEAR